MFYTNHLARPWTQPYELCECYCGTNMVPLHGLNTVGILNRSIKLECPNNLAYGTRLLVGGMWHIFWIGCQFRIGENILHKTIFFARHEKQEWEWRSCTPCNRARHCATTLGKFITWGVLTSFDQLCHQTYCALPHQRLHLLLFTHINQMSQTLIKGASNPNNSVFVCNFSMFMKVAFYTLLYVVFLLFWAYILVGLQARCILNHQKWFENTCIKNDISNMN
jgi:hypothetical protein